MEFFTKTNAVKLRSHINKYLLADEDLETVRQSRNVKSRRSTWTVEQVPLKPKLIRLKSCDGKYLTAAETPFLLGMTGQKVVQATLSNLTVWQTEWEPVRDGFQVKLRSWSGKFLRANGGPPPWRNAVTHDEPFAKKDWVLWDVEPASVSSLDDTSSFSSVTSEEAFGSEPGSPISVGSMKSPRFSFASMKSPKFSVVSSFSAKLGRKSVSSFFERKDPKLISSELYCELPRLVTKQTERGTGMDFFDKAKVVRLRSHHDKYLLADEDEESVTQDRNGSSKNVKWTVERVPGSTSVIRLKSCYSKYLTASNKPFLLGATGKKCLQTRPSRLDSSVEWEPVREAGLVKLKTRYGHFLRANGGVPPWRNHVTHDIPHRTATQEWILWDVAVLEIDEGCHNDDTKPNHVPTPASPLAHADSLDFSPTFGSMASGKLSRLETSDSFVVPIPKSEGRTIYYSVADESGEVDDDVVEGSSLIIVGTSVEELTRMIKEETGLEDIIVCTRSPLNGRIFPLRLQLPPNNADMHVIVVPKTSKLAKDFV